MGGEEGRPPPGGCQGSWGSRREPPEDVEGGHVRVLCRPVSAGAQRRPAASDRHDYSCISCSQSPKAQLWAGPHFLQRLQGTLLPPLPQHFLCSLYLPLQFHPKLHALVCAVPILCVASNIPTPRRGVSAHSFLSETLSRIAAQSTKITLPHL